MPSTSLERRLYLPYSAGQIFDLVADVEQYPAFVPGWRAVQVVKRDGGSMVVDQHVELGPASSRFRTETCLDRPNRIRVSSIDAPFGHLSIAWSFEPLGDDGCAVVFRADYNLGHAMLQRVAAGFMERRLLQVVSAFESRARRTCGRPGTPEPG